MTSCDLIGFPPQYIHSVFVHSDFKTQEKLGNQWDCNLHQVSWLIQKQPKFTKVAGLAQMIFCEFCEISKNTCFTEHLCATVSVNIETKQNRTEMKRHSLEAFKKLYSIKLLKCFVTHVWKKTEEKTSPSLSPTCYKNHSKFFKYFKLCRKRNFVTLIYNRKTLAVSQNITCKVFCWRQKLSI